MATTTFATIRDQYCGTRGPTAAVGKIPALTPTSRSDVKFERCPPRQRLRTFAAAGGSKVFRRFELYSKGWQEEAHHEADVYRRIEQAELLIAYPATAVAWGLDEQLDIADIQEEDIGGSGKIRDAIYGSGNYVTGQLEGSVSNVTYERPDDAIVWFTVCDITLRYYAAQSLP